VPPPCMGALLSLLFIIFRVEMEVEWNGIAERKLSSSIPFLPIVIVRDIVV
jgi:hypothetical protein